MITVFLDCDMRVSNTVKIEVLHMIAADINYNLQLKKHFKHAIMKHYK